ncbi:hypothetical protein JCM11491_005113 [Sporobolomyces phaffii]
MNESVNAAGASGQGAAAASTVASSSLWSGILDSVKGSRTVGTRQCIVLGAPHSGKSTLVQRISNPNGDLVTPPRTRADPGEDPLDLAMSYSVLEVKDEGSGDEETLARLSIYQLPSPAPPFPALLPLALSKKTLLDSLVVIVLDWERPWSFLDELRNWIAMLRSILRAEAGGDDVYEVAEAKERSRTQLRTYHDPAPTTNGGTPSAMSAAPIDTDAPLPPGTLLENLGIPIVVVCTKADHINVLEREREFTEEQFDYIQQTLRTVCLRYGASLFFTSQTLPTSFSKLRQYILHRLLSSSSSTAVASGSSAPTVAATTGPPPPTATATRAFPFPHRANVIDRDQILVPAGWDSWGKITILREKFDCAAAGRGWERDLGREGRSSARGDAGAGDTRGPERGVGEDVDEDEEGGIAGLKREYDMVVVDFEAQDRPTHSTSKVVPQDEQAFLQTHYAALQADLEKDPRLAFRHQPSSSLSSHSFGAHSSLSSSSATRNGVVGPMSGHIRDLPTVQSALERASHGGGGTTSAQDKEGPRGASGEPRDRTSNSRAAGAGPSMTRQSSASSNLPPRTSHLAPSSSASASNTPLASHNTKGPGAGGGGGTAGSAAGGNQVLADFFQSLLTARSGSALGSGAATPSGSGGDSSGATGAGSSATTGALPRTSESERPTR